MVGRGAAAPMWATEHKKPVPDDKLLLHPSCNGQGGKGGCRKCVRLKIGVGTLERIDQGHFIIALRGRKPSEHVLPHCSIVLFNIICLNWQDLKAKKISSTCFGSILILATFILLEILGLKIGKD